MLKAADICASEPERAARMLASKGYEPRYPIGLEVLKSLDYTRWRTSNPKTLCASTLCGCMRSD